MKKEASIKCNLYFNVEKEYTLNEKVMLPYDKYPEIEEKLQEITKKLSEIGVEVQFHEFDVWEV